jgi:hypothetical protein
MKHRALLVCLSVVVLAAGGLSSGASSAPDPGAVPARIVFDDTHLDHPTNYFGYHGFAAFDATGARVIGSYDTWTAVVAGPNGPKTFTGYLDYYGRGVFGYRGGSTSGVDTLTVSIGPATGQATRAYGIENTLPLPPPRTPARIEFDDNHLDHPTDYFGYHGFTVFDATNKPVIGSYDEWTAAVTGPNGPLTFSGNLDYYGRAVFGYRAGIVPGIDTLAVTVGSATGAATRSYQGDVVAPVDPIGLLPPEPDPDLPVLPNPNAPAARIVFDDEHFSHPTNYFGYHGFRAYDAAGAPIVGQNLQWTAVVVGPNAQTFSGRLDHYGRGVFGYRAGTVPGVDTLTVSIGAATGEATRAYGQDSLVTLPSSPKVAARIEFDDNHYAVEPNYYGYHGFQVYGPDNAPLKASYNDWVAVVTGANGPLTFTGKLDFYGRGVFGYFGELGGTDALVVTVGTATGDATRTYDTGSQIPQVPIPILPETPTMIALTSPGPGHIFDSPLCPQEWLDVARGVCTHADYEQAFSYVDEAYDSTYLAETSGSDPGYCRNQGSTRKVVVLYVWNRDHGNRYDGVKDNVRDKVKRADHYLWRSARQNGSRRHFRYACTDGGTIKVTSVRIGDGEDNNKDETFDAIEKWATDETKKYLAFVDWAPGSADALPSGYRPCGWGDRFADDSPGQTNLNNGGNMFAIAYMQGGNPNCFDRLAHVAAHEMTHMLGAVQKSAPHHRGAHATDGYDLMMVGNNTGVCSDGTSYNRLDCNDNDYFNADPTLPAEGTYLADQNEYENGKCQKILNTETNDPDDKRGTQCKWNTAWNRFLVGGG